jgi:hypothetical protein
MLLAFGFAMWSFFVYSANGEVLYLLVMILSCLFGIGLVVYGGRFLRQLEAMNLIHN